jgi:hypothetical protein
MFEAYARPSEPHKYTPMVLSAPIKKDLALMVYKTYGLNWKNCILLRNERCLLPPSNCFLPIVPAFSNTISTSSVPPIVKIQNTVDNKTNSSNISGKPASNKRRRTFY